MSEPLTIRHHGGSYRINDPGPDSIIGSCLRDGLPYEHGVLEHIYENLDHDGIAVDVGAGVGNHTLWFAAICMYPRVVAFEPIDFDRLQENVMLNPGLNITAHRAAVAEFNGRTTVFSAPKHVVGNTPVEDGEVEAVTLDAAGRGAGPVRLLKVDVEGMEESVLKGAMGLIEQHRPHIFAECATELAQRHLDRLLSSLSYSYVRSWGATPLGEWAP